MNMRVDKQGFAQEEKKKSLYLDSKQSHLFTCTMLTLSLIALSLHYRLLVCLLRLFICTSGEGSEMQIRVN